MKTVYITDLQSGGTFSDEPFLVQESTLLRDKNNNPFYSLTIGDKTGSLAAKIWPDQLKQINTKLLKPGKVLAISGTVQDFKGQRQISILDLKEVDETKLDEYLNSSAIDLEQMWAELWIEVESIQDTALKATLSQILNSDVFSTFRYHPAGKVIHHDFRGGLLQHALEMISISKSLFRFYPYIDTDLVLAGCTLHDIGKILELQKEDLSYRFSRDGLLLGHIYLAAEYVDRLAVPELSVEKKKHLQHIILSSHGKKELGSPVLPATSEALLVANADKLSYYLGVADKYHRRQGVLVKDEDGLYSEFDKYLDTKLIIE